MKKYVPFVASALTIGRDIFCCFCSVTRFSIQPKINKPFPGLNNTYPKKSQATMHQSCGSGLIESGSGSSISSKSGSNPHPGFWWPKTEEEKNTAEHFCMKRSELWSLLKYSSSKFKKNQKHIAVDVLFKAYPMIPLSGWSNLAGRYLTFKCKGS